ncbi:MAG: phospholipase D-like domain-containing protein [Armatimonadota bacterium]
MNVRVIDNFEAPLDRLLSDALTEAQEARFAVGFVSKNGLALVEKRVLKVLEAGGDVEFIVALDGEATESGAVRLLYELSCCYECASLYCYPPLGPSKALYHPKMYLVRHAEARTCIIGSSNLTNAGLAQNLEVNVLIEGDATDEPVSDAYGAYARLKHDRRCVSPDDHLIDLYEDLWQCSEELRTSKARAQKQRALVKALGQHMKGLPCPERRRSDLIGWLGMVYDVLPEGEFTNRDVYRYEKQFKEHYPNNENVQAKIRQQLQRLRDMGVVEHSGPGRWRLVTR